MFALSLLMYERIEKVCLCIIRFNFLVSFLIKND
jgi:hypothetical protein